MAKLTIKGLKDFTKAYVDASKQAGAWTSSTNNMLEAIEKIGKMVTIDGDYGDKLPELTGDDLPLGKTIEEWMIDLTLPENFVDPADSESGFDPLSALKPYFPETEDCYYSYSLGRKKIATSIPYDNFERACLSSEDAANMEAKIMEKLEQSEQATVYAIKRQLLGNMATKAVAAGCVEELAAPADTATGEDFVIKLKDAVEVASDINEGNTLGGVTAGAAPALTLYLKQGIMSTVDVHVLAGAFHDEKLAIPATIKVIKDFGDCDAKIFGILVDTRGVKLHNGYKAVRTQPNGSGDYLNIFKHFEDTGFISKSTYVRVYKAK